MNWTTKARKLSVLPIAVALGACDILTVTDPGRYDDEDLNDALEAVANSVEGSAQEWADWYVNWQSMLSDVYMFTGYDYPFYSERWGLIDEGRVNYGTFPTIGVNFTYGKYNFPDGMSQAGWFAGESWKRLVAVRGDADANSIVMGAQVLLGDALLDMYAGLFSCEAVLDPAPSRMAADIQIYHHAAESFSKVMEVARNIDPEVLEDLDVDFENAGRTGRALMLMLRGDYEGAVSEAAGVPDDFSYNAIHSSSNFLSFNEVARWTNWNRTRIAGLMPWLSDRIVGSGATYITDKWTGELDERMPVYNSGRLGTDYETPHFSQWKYVDLAADIPILHSGHARLIEAEAKVMSGDFGGATAILNNLRGRVGLAALPVATNEELMMEYLLEERFAELFMEGHRAVDLHRFGLTREIFEAMDDPFRRGIGRPSKFPGSKREARLNTMVEDQESIRCAPVA